MGANDKVAATFHPDPTFVSGTGLCHTGGLHRFGRSHGGMRWCMNTDCNVGVSG